MIRLKKRLTKQVEIINSTISNDEERQKVMLVIQDMIKEFTTSLVQLDERVNQIEENMNQVYDVMNQIENVFEDYKEDGEAVAVCPYCGEEIPIFKDFKDGEELVCPSCHNIIEVHIDQPLDDVPERNYSNVIDIAQYIDTKSQELKCDSKKSKSRKKNKSKNDD